MRGRRITSAPCIARAAISVSGTKKSPFSKRRPTSSRDGMRALKRMSMGSMPSFRPSSVRAFTSGAWPLSVCSKSSARISSSRLMCGGSCVAHRPTDAQSSTVYVAAGLPATVMLRNEQRGAPRDRGPLGRACDLDPRPSRGGRLAHGGGHRPRAPRPPLDRPAPARHAGAAFAGGARPADGPVPPRTAPPTAGQRCHGGVRPSVRRAARLRAPRRGRGETVTLDVLVGDVIVPIEQATGSTSVVSVNWLGRRTPVHCTASGKAILAFGPAAVRERLLGMTLEQVTPQTITSRAELEAQLEAALASGVAHTHAELEVGLDAIEDPVFGADGEIG